MIHAKTNRYGVEVPIYLAQQDLQDNLQWQDLTKVDIYGKIERTTRNGKVIPEAFISNGEYKEVFCDDRRHAVVGFLVDDVRGLDGEYFNADVSVIFTVRLDKIHSTDNRDTEKTIIEAIRALNLSSENIIEIREGIESVFQGFDTEHIENRGMGKWFVFSIKFKMFYIDNYC